jgi:leader peptidase (prepilin peptidase)/N-methyltransferase
MRILPQSIKISIPITSFASLNKSRLYGILNLMEKILVFQSVAAFLFGSVIGSFLNVCIYRIPRKESIVFPASHCPKCDKNIKPYDNIPIISYIFLKGRCRNCGKKISFLYPLVEFLNAVGYAFIICNFGLNINGLIYALLYSSLIVVTFIDLEHQIIPDRITLPGIIIGFILGATVLPVGWQNSLIGLFLGGGLFYLVAVLSRGGMGGGDIKLIAMIGAFLGWQSALLTIFLGALAGSVVGLFLMTFKGKGRKHRVPFGPFLALGAVAALFWGNYIINWYINFGR